MKPVAGSPADSLLPWKIGLFFTGAALWAAGAATEREWLIWAALVLVAAGFGLRLVAREKDPGD